MSKMGIAVISSYRGAYNFEAVGLSRTLVAEFFPGMHSRISGIGLAGIQLKVLEIHERAFDEDVVALPVGGFYRYRQGGEPHAFEGTLIHTLQTAVATDSYATYKRYADGVRKMPPVNLRDLLDFKPREAGDLARRGRVDHRDPQAPRDARHVAGRARARGARDAVDRDEPHRRQVG